MRGRLRSIVLGIEVAVLLAVCAPTAMAASAIGHDGEGDGRRTAGEAVPGEDGAASTGVSVRVLPAPSGSPTGRPDPPRPGGDPVTGTGASTTDSAPWDLDDLPAGTSHTESGSRQFGKGPNTETHTWSNHVEVHEFGDSPYNGRGTTRMESHEFGNEIPAIILHTPTTAPVPRQTGNLPFTGIDGQSLGIVVGSGVAAILLGAYFVRMSLRRRRSAPHE